MTKDATKRKRGFGGMSPEKRKAIQSSGGRAAQESGRAHRWTPDEAREAGQKGGRPRKEESDE